MIIGKLQIVGLNEYFLNENILFKSKVISDKSVIYSINRNV